MAGRSSNKLRLSADDLIDTLDCLCPPLAQSGHTEMSAIRPLSLAKRTLASDRHPIAIYEYTLTRASQLGGDLEAKGPWLTRRDVVVAIRRGPIALVEDVLDIEPRLPGRVDLREDAGVEAQEARQVDAVSRTNSPYFGAAYHRRQVGYRRP